MSESMNLSNDYEKLLWVSVYKSVIKGLYLNDKSNGIEAYEARQQADEAIIDYRKAVGI